MFFLEYSFQNFEEHPSPELLKEQFQFGITGHTFPAFFSWFLNPSNVEMSLLESSCAAEVGFYSLLDIKCN